MYPTGGPTVSCGPAVSSAIPTGVGQPNLVAQVIRDSISVPENYRNLEPNRGWVAGEPMGPLSSALTFPGASLVDAGAFRTLGANSGLIRLLVGRDFKVRALPERKARNGKKNATSGDWV